MKSLLLNFLLLISFSSNAYIPLEPWVEPNYKYVPIEVQDVAVQAFLDNDFQTIKNLVEKDGWDANFGDSTGNFFVYIENEPYLENVFNAKWEDLSPVQEKIFQYLVDNGADVNYLPSRFGTRPLSTALTGADFRFPNTCRPNFVKFLLRNGADVNKGSRSVSRWTPPWYSTGPWCGEEAIKAVIAHKPDIIGNSCGGPFGYRFDELYAAVERRPDLYGVNRQPDLYYWSKYFQDEYGAPALNTDEWYIWADKHCD